MRLSDRKQLPLVEAAVLETLRMHSPVPLGIVNSFTQSPLGALEELVVLKFLCLTKAAAFVAVVTVAQWYDSRLESERSLVRISLRRGGKAQP